MGWSAFSKQGDTMNSNLPLSLNRKVFKQGIFPVLTSAQKLGISLRNKKEKLRSAQRVMERKMLGATWRDRKRATWIREQTKVEDILGTIKVKDWSWAGHTIRRTDNRWTRRVTEWQPRNCNRSQGRQKIRWRDDVTAFLGAGWSTLTSDREVEGVGNGLCPAVGF